MSSKTNATGACHPTEAAPAKPVKSVVYADIDATLHRQFKAACDLRGQSIRSRVGELIAGDVTASPVVLLGGVSHAPSQG